jgi:hypothetical protein
LLHYEKYEKYVALENIFSGALPLLKPVTRVEVKPQKSGNPASFFPNLSKCESKCESD